MTTMTGTTQSSLARFGRLIAPFSGLVLVLVIFAAIEPDSFLSVSNGRTIAVQTVVVGIGAVGMCFVIISGGIDLSIGSVIALASVVGALTLDAGYSPTVAVLAAAGVGTACGICNGALITALRIAPFIVTLGMLGIARGLAQYLAENQRVAPPSGSLGWLETFLAKNPDPSWFGTAPAALWLFGMAVLAVIVLRKTGIALLLIFLGLLVWFFNPSWLRIAHAAWWLFGMAVLAGIVLRKTPFGVHVYALGSSEPTARLCGVPVGRTKIMVYALSGLAAGLAGAVMLGRLGVGDPTTAVGKELAIIAAVVIGGASLSGGEGSILGAMIGAFMLSTLAAGCNLAGIDNSIQEIIIGGIIVAAVTLDGLRHRRRT